MPRSVYALVFALALAIPIGSANAQPAAAYGADAVYQIGLSFNCNDKVACALSDSNPFGPGGFWGWIELDSTTHPGTSGTAEIVVTGCSHDTPFTGATHFTLDGTWFTSADGSTLFVSTATFGGVFFAAPAASGHYSQHPQPGIAMELQVTRIPNR